jgi:hypothetical protein
LAIFDGLATDAWNDPRLDFPRSELNRTDPIIGTLKLGLEQFLVIT